MVRFAVSSLYDRLIRSSETLSGFVLDEIRDPSVAYVKIWFADNFKISKL